MIDILAILFIIGVFVNFGYSKYKKKKAGIVGCEHCSGCAKSSSCSDKK